MDIKILDEIGARRVAEAHPYYPNQTGNVGRKATVIPKGDFRKEYNAIVLRDDKERRGSSEGELVAIFLLEDGRCLTNRDLYFYSFLK